MSRLPFLVHQIPFQSQAVWTEPISSNMTQKYNRPSDLSLQCQNNLPSDWRASRMGQPIKWKQNQRHVIRFRLIALMVSIKAVLSSHCKHFEQAHGLYPCIIFAGYHKKCWFISGCVVVICTVPQAQNTDSSLCIHASGSIFWFYEDRCEEKCYDFIYRVKNLHYTVTSLVGLKLLSAALRWYICNYSSDAVDSGRMADVSLRLNTGVDQAVLSLPTRLCCDSQWVSCNIVFLHCPISPK